MEIIKVNNLSKKFGDFLAVNNISFAVQKGEVFGFLGPNGAGKTTTINMLTGLARPTTGEIETAGFNAISQIKKVQKLIGIVPDESNLYDDLSGFDNLSFCAALYGLPRGLREERATRLLKEFKLDDTGKRPFKAFSKGMKRKLTIAAGIIHEPEILFLDEPTTGIDVESARQIRQLIKDLHQRGTTIFLTTHYIEEAERLCNRIGFIAGGKIIKISSVEDLLNEAQQENTVEFALSDNWPALLPELKSRFIGFGFEVTGQNRLRVTSGEAIKLMPFMHYFEENSVMVSEARVIKPSLEDIFVKVTGIEVEKMTGEKGGKKK